jgi:hypothetical protein
MPQIKPNDFPVRPVLDGSEEVYTQTNGVNQKFLLSNAVNYITNNIDIWDLKVVYVTELELFNLFFTPIKILDEADLAPNEYYEINRIVIELSHNITFVANKEVWFQFKTNAATSFINGNNFYKIRTELLEGAEDLITCSYTPYTHVPYPRNTGLYIHSAGNVTLGNGTFKVKVYYRVSI